MATHGVDSELWDEYWKLYGAENPLSDPSELWDPNFLTGIGDSLQPLGLIEEPRTEVKVSIRTSTTQLPVPDLHTEIAQLPVPDLHTETAQLPVPELLTETARKIKIKKEKKEDKDFVPSPIGDDKKELSRIEQIEQEIADFKKELEATKSNGSLNAVDMRRECNRISAAISRRTKELVKLNAKNEAAELKDKLKEAKKQIQALEQANMALQAENEFLKKRLENTVQETAVVVTVSSPSKKGSGFMPLYQSSSSLRASSTGGVFEDPTLRVSKLNFSK